MSAQATQDQWAILGHYYEPIPLYNGLVLKYAGLACPMNLDHMLAKPGMILLDAYRGDRIVANTYEPFHG
jgi:hypothetical protein